jgi:hypothetical protein
MTSFLNRIGKFCRNEPAKANEEQILSATTTSALTPTTHGLRVAASFNPFYDPLNTGWDGAGGSSSIACVSNWKASDYDIAKGLSHTGKSAWISRRSTTPEKEDREMLRPFLEREG